MLVGIGNTASSRLEELMSVELGNECSRAGVGFQSLTELLKFEDTARN